MHRGTVVWAHGKEHTSGKSRWSSFLRPSCMHHVPGEQRVVTYVADGDPSRGRHPTEIRSIFHGSPRKSLGGAPLTSILDANLRGAASARADNETRAKHSSHFASAAPWRRESSSTRSGVSTSLISQNAGMLRANTFEQLIMWNLRVRFGGELGQRGGQATNISRGWSSLGTREMPDVERFIEPATVSFGCNYNEEWSMIAENRINIA